MDGTGLSKKNGFFVSFLSCQDRFDKLLCYATLRGYLVLGKIKMKKVQACNLSLCLKIIAGSVCNLGRAP